MIAVALQALGDLEGQLERLVGVEARIAMGVVAFRQGLFGDRLSAADTLGYVGRDPQ